MASPVDALVSRPQIDAAIAAWLNEHRARRFFHLVGGPGSGKSSWVDLLARNFACGNASGARVVAIHRCRRTDIESTSARAFLQSVSSQIAAAEPAFAEALLSAAADNQSFKLTLPINQHIYDSPGAVVTGVQIGTLVLAPRPVGELIGSVLRMPLEAALGEEGPNWLIVLDGLDEAADGDLPQLLLGLGALPPRLRIILTSRADDALVRELDRLGSDRLALGAGPAELDDVRRFVEARGGEADLFSRLEPNLTPASFIQQVAGRAGGSFLVARCTVDALAVSPGIIGMGDIEDCPTELSGAYLHLLTRMPAELHRNWSTRGGAVLGTLAVAREPLRDDQIAAATGLRSGDVRAFVVDLRHYLDRVDGLDRVHWRIFHTSFGAFLLDAKAEEFRISAADQHAGFADWADRAAGSDDLWAEADAYPLRHGLAHRAAVGGPGLLKELEARLTPGFLTARLALDGDGWRAAEDIRLSAKVACERRDVSRALLFTLLHHLWLDRAAHEASVPLAMVLVAEGKLDVAIARVAERAGKDDGGPLSSGEDRRAFIAGLVDSGETHAALALAERMPSDLRTAAYAAVIDALAIHDPQHAATLLPLASDPSWSGPAVSSGACRALARAPGLVSVALSAAGGSAAHVAAAIEGCATHDLPGALALIDRTAEHIEDLGGERLWLGHSRIAARACAARLEAQPGDADIVWPIADALTGIWQQPEGFRLLTALTAAGHPLHAAAFARLLQDDPGLMDPLAALYGGTTASAAMFQQLASGLPPSVWKPRWESDAPLSLFGSALRDALSTLAYLGVDRLVAVPHLRPLLEPFAHRLLAALGANTDAPEFKYQIAELLGYLFASLGDEWVAPFVALVADSWRDTGASLRMAVGVARAHGERSVDAVLDARRRGAIPNLDQHVANVAAVGPAAVRDPDDALRLIDAVDPRYLQTRAALASVIGLEMRRQRRGDPASLRRRLSAYVEGAYFADAVHAIQRGARLSPIEGLEVARMRAVQDLIADGSQEALLKAARLCAYFSAESRQRVDGRSINAATLAQRLARGLLPTDPALALACAARLVPNEALVAVAAEAIAADRRLAGPGALLALLSEIDQNADVVGTLSLAARASLRLALALVLPSIATAYLDELSRKEHQVAEAIQEVLLLSSYPLDVAIERLEALPTGVFRHWIADHVVRALATRDHKAALAHMLDSHVDERAATLLAEAAMHAWPIEAWRDGLAAILDGSESLEKRRICKLAAQRLLQRVAEVDPSGAVNAAYGHELLDSSVRRWVLDAACSAESTEPSAWADFAARAIALETSVGRESVLTDLLAGIAQFPGDTRRDVLCATFAALLDAPSHVILELAEPIAHAAAIASPEAGIDEEAITVRLRSLLAA